MLALVLVWVRFLEPLPPEVVYCLFAYIRAKHFEFGPSCGVGVCPYNIKVGRCEVGLRKFPKITAVRR